MDKLIQEQTLVAPKGGINVSALKSNKYRSLIFAFLDKLTGANVEIIEQGCLRQFGDTHAKLKGQIQVNDDSFYKDVLASGSIGAAEAYIAGKWSSPDLTQLIEIMALNQAQLDKLESQTRWLSRIKKIITHFSNRNTQQGSKRNILAHYDIGNELYTRFLDKEMQYSCGIYSQQAQELESAQVLKMHTICERLELKSEDRVIEIGTGWGGLAIFMAQHYGCHVTTTTISDAQYDYAVSRVNDLGLADKVTLLKQDYRTLDGQYDKLVSIEMIEAVGHEYLPNFFATCSGLLKSDGKMLIQSITIADSRYESYRKSTDFIQKYIFPGGCLPSIAQMSHQIASQTDMVVEQIDDIGLHYARTLYDWRLKFEQAWPELVELGYSQEFKRLWLFYLCYCEGAFRQRVISTHHLVARKPRYRGQSDEMVLDY